MNQLCCFYSKDDADYDEIGGSRSLAARSTRPGTYTSSRQFEDGAPTDKKWYHGGITDAEANRLIPVVCSNGLYLVYDCPTSKRDYVLLVKVDNELHRFKIIKRRSDNKYVLGKDTQGTLGHETVRKLIKYHRGLTGKPLILNDGRRVVLGDYVYRPGYN